MAPILSAFVAAQLPAEAFGIADPFHRLALLVVSVLPPNAERQRSLEKLLEAKDAAVASKLCGVSA